MSQLLRNSEETLKVRGAQKRIFMVVRCAALFVLPIFEIFPTISLAQSPCPPSIHVEILNIRNSTGSVACGLFESPHGFPTEYLCCATNIMITKVRDKQVSFDFQGIAPGTYALVAVHDENVNGKLDTNWLGIPKEGYGFSNGAKAFLKAPSFHAASFSYDGRNLDVTISLHY